MSKATPNVSANPRGRYFPAELRQRLSDDLHVTGKANALTMDTFGPFGNCPTLPDAAPTGSPKPKSAGSFCTSRTIAGLPMAHFVSLCQV